MAAICRVQLPDFGRPSELPEIPVAEYLSRLAQVTERMARRQLDVLAVYADREHFATLAYLTGLDPRFEEALLLLDRSGARRLLVGNEGLGYLPDPAVVKDVVLFQEFSLMGQPRDRSRDLRSLLAGFGIGQGTRVGCVDWKYYTAALVGEALTALNLPAYLADLLRDLCGSRQAVQNATDIFMHPQDGLRVVNSTAQLAQFEFAGCVASEGVRTLLQHLQPGVSERELEKYLDGRGLPRSCHAMVGFGEKAARGLASPGNQRLKAGQPYTTAFGVWGALTARAGMLAGRAEDLPSGLREYYLDFSGNYYDVVAAWYEALRVGARCRDVFAAVSARRNPALLDFALNPGHYLHLDEWVHSPFDKDSSAVLVSGMALQSDIIPVGRGPGLVCANAEDGVVLADAAERRALAEQFPECWQRMQARRRFMAQTLGIVLDDSVLPTGNIPGWLPPLALNPELAFTAGSGDRRPL
ncbi:MAG: hypothetical protein ABSE73_32930 [Planctomycetota bacterium]